MNKALKPIISVLALAALIAVGLVFYNERIINREKSILDAEGNPIEWVKYENKELGFLFEYPSNLFLVKRETKDYEKKYSPLSTKLFLDRVVISEKEHMAISKFAVFVNILKNPQRLKPKDWIRWHEKQDDYPLDDVTIEEMIKPLKDTRINDMRATIFEDGDWVDITITKGDKAAIIIFLDETRTVLDENLKLIPRNEVDEELQKKADLNEKTFKQILATFKID